MAWSDTTPGRVRSWTKKYDYDRVFDNQQQLKDEYNLYHHHTNSGTVYGWHDGIEMYNAVTTVALSTTATILTTALSNLNKNGLWRLVIHAWYSNSYRVYHELLINESIQNLDAYYSQATNTSIGHPGGADVATGAPTAPYFRVYVDSSDNLKVDFTSDASGTYKVRASIHQISNYKV